MHARLAIGLAREKTVRCALLATIVFVVFAPVLVLAGTVSVLSQSAAQACSAGGEVEQAAGGQAIAATALAAQPLRLQAGRSYEVGATEYGGPDDPSSSSYGSIPNPSQSYLPAHPDTYAELSVLVSNPANHGSFTFADSNALHNLPYLTALRVSRDGRSLVLYKRDIGYGQGPGQTIANGEPFRLDLWWRSARVLGVSRDPVRIQLAPAGGAAPTLGQSAGAEESGGAGGAAAGAGGEYDGSEADDDAPLPLVPGARTLILASGLAAAGREAPVAVKRMVAAGNRMFGTAYLYGGGHGSSLDTLQTAYDCSSAVSFVLHAGGVLGSSALDSTGLASYGLPGPGRYVSIYANSGHAFMYVGGLRFDTVFDRAYDSGPNSGKPGPRWRVYPSVPGWASWTVRHPPGL
jgi:hypothetical protein